MKKIVLLSVVFSIVLMSHAQERLFNNVKQTESFNKMSSSVKKATIFEKPRLENNRIDLKNESIPMIQRKIRALSKPYKGAYIEKEGKRLILWKAEIIK